MVTNKHIVFLFLGFLVSIVFLFLVIELVPKKDTVEIIQSEKTNITKGFTLLERMYADVDSDGKDESIELYTSAQKGPNELMGWDDGQQWILLIRDDEKIFPLFEDYIQLGQLEFYVSVFSKSKVVSPTYDDLKMHIYVIKTSHDIQLIDYYWDKQNSCFKKEIVFDPPNQWNIKFSYKYTAYDPTRIESMK